MNAVVGEPEGSGTQQAFSCETQQMIERAEVRLQAETERLIAERIDGAVKHRLAEVDRWLGGLQRKAIDTAERRLDETVLKRLGQAERANLKRLQVERERIGAELRTDLRKQGAEHAGKEQRRLQAALDERLRQMSDAMLVRAEPQLHNRAEEILVAMRADVHRSLDEGSAEILQKLSTAANDRLNEIERRGDELRRAAYEGAAVELAERLESRISSHVGALEERFEKAFEERVQRTGKSVLAQIEPKLRDRLQEIRRAVDSELRAGSTEASEEMMANLDRAVAESEKRLTAMGEEQMATLERRGEEVNEKLDRIATSASNELDNLTERVRAASDARLAAGIKRIDERLTSAIDEADKRSRKRVNRQLAEEADRLVTEGLGKVSQRRLREVELAAEHALVKYSEEFTSTLGHKAKREAEEHIARLQSTAREQLEKRVEELHAGSEEQVRTEIDRALTELREKLAAQAERLALESERLRDEAEERVRNQAVKRLRHHMTELEGAAAAAYTRASSARGGTPSAEDEQTERGHG